MRKERMTPRERVMASLNHQEPDRVPIDLGQAVGDGITLTAYRNLLRHLGMNENAIQVKDRRGQTARVDEEVLGRFRVDFRGLGLGPPENRTDRWLDDRTYEDEWGVVRTMPPGSYYYDLIRAPFAEDASLSAIDRHRWPDPSDPGRFRDLREKARRLHEQTEYAIVVDLNCAFFLRCCELRGWENFYMDLVANVEFAEALMDRFLGIRLAIAERALQEVGANADIVMVTSDDLGGTDRTLISPALYRSLIKPRQKRTFDFFKARTGAKLYYHTDGAVYPLIPDLIEIGVEALNPVQVSAAGMGDTQKLKREFGDRLTFWGAIDTHRVLPYGTPGQVREEVRRRILDLGPSGGYVVCPVHNIQPEVPPENVVAMYDAAYDLGSYPLRA
ncbi:MAG TPA: uroporphyrinogen decarboxylase family protein [Candidatus Acidoferrum sp.]|nr:uroporphyrinogen decarboxylase family protein [Candidatus Acidoferrum sp.]